MIKRLIRENKKIIDRDNTNKGWKWKDMII